MPAPSFFPAAGSVANSPLNGLPIKNHWISAFGLGALVWAACTLLLLCFRPGYAFPPYELLDTWIYSSYQWDLQNQIADFGPTYYGSRLSWILPGALIHHFLPPVAAELCYKLVVSALFALACGTIVYAVRGLAAGMLTVGLSVAAPQIIVALHADYIDTPVIVYAALALACIVPAKESRYWPVWIFLAGLCFSGMVVANLSSFAAPGLGVALFHLIWLRWGFGRLIASLVLYAAAAAAVLGVVELISRHEGATFFFLKPQIDMLFYMNGLKDKNPWTPKSWGWAWTATWLVLPACTLLCGLFRSLVFPSADARVQRLTVALTAGLAASLGSALVFELRGMGVLSLYYYSSFHLCLALPLLALICTSSVRAGRSAALWFAGTLGSVMAIVLWGSNPAGLFAVLGPWQFVLLWAAAVLLGSALGTELWRRRAGKPAPHRWFGGELLLAGIVLCSLPDSFHGTEISDRLRERYASVHAAYRVLAREFSPGSFRFWVDGAYRDGISLASTKLWGYRLLTLKLFPEFEQPDLGGHTIVVPAAPGKGTQILDLARTALTARELEMVSPRILPVSGDAGTGFDLVCFGMQMTAIDPEQSATGTPTAVPLLDLKFDTAEPYIRTLQSNLYGPTHEEALRVSAGVPVFTRTDPRDHLATPFLSFPKAKPGATRRLSVVVTMPAIGHTSCVVQTEGYQEIGRLVLNHPGRSVLSVIVPADRQTLRIYFMADTADPTPLPTRLAIYEIEP